MRRVRGSIGDAIKCCRSRESIQASLTLSNLLHCPARSRYAEPMIAASHTATEVDKATICAPGGGSGQHFPRRRQVLHLAAFCRHSVNVDSSAMVLFSADP